MNPDDALFRLMDRSRNERPQVRISVRTVSGIRNGGVEVAFDGEGPELLPRLRGYSPAVGDIVLVLYTPIGPLVVDALNPLIPEDPTEPGTAEALVAMSSLWLSEEA